MAPVPCHIFWKDKRCKRAEGEATLVCKTGPALFPHRKAFLMQKILLRNTGPHDFVSAKFCKQVLIWILLYLLLPAVRRAEAQFETASVLGYVRDGGGQAVAGSTVKLINTE